MPRCSTSIVNDALRDRAADIPIKDAGLEIRLVWRERITRIEIVVAEQSHELAVKFVRAGFREDLDATEAEPVILGREGVPIDTHFANRGFRRQSAVTVAVDEDLPTVGPGAGAGQRLQVVLQLVGIVERTSRSWPRSTSAPAFESGSTLTCAPISSLTHLLRLDRDAMVY